MPSKVPKVPKQAKAVAKGPKKKVINQRKETKNSVKVATVKPNGQITGTETVAKPANNPFKVNTFHPKVMANGTNTVSNGPICGTQAVKDQTKDIKLTPIKPKVSVDSTDCTEATIQPKTEVNSQTETDIKAEANNKSESVVKVEVNSKSELKVASVKPKVKPTNKKRKSANQLSMAVNESNLITTNPVNEPLPPVDSALMSNFEQMLSTVKKKKKQQKKTSEDMFRLLCNSKVSPFTVSPFLFTPPAESAEPLNLCAPSKRSPTPVNVMESPKLNGTDSGHSGPPIQCNTI